MYHITTPSRLHDSRHDTMHPGRSCTCHITITYRWHDSRNDTMHTISSPGRQGKKGKKENRWQDVVCELKGTSEGQVYWQGCEPEKGKGEGQAEGCCQSCCRRGRFARQKKEGGKVVWQTTEGQGKGKGKGKAEEARSTCDRRMGRLGIRVAKTITYLTTMSHITTCMPCHYTCTVAVDF